MWQLVNWTWRYRFVCFLDSQLLFRWIICNIPLMSAKQCHWRIKLQDSLKTTKNQQNLPFFLLSKNCSGLTNQKLNTNKTKKKKNHIFVSFHNLVFYSEITFDGEHFLFTLCLFWSFAELILFRDCCVVVAFESVTVQVVEFFLSNAQFQNSFGMLRSSTKAIDERYLVWTFVKIATFYNFDDDCCLF